MHADTHCSLYAATRVLTQAPHGRVLAKRCRAIRAAACRAHLHNGGHPRLAVVELGQRVVGSPHIPELCQAAACNGGAAADRGHITGKIHHVGAEVLVAHGLADPKYADGGCKKQLPSAQLSVLDTEVHVILQLQMTPDVVALRLSSLSWLLRA